MTDARTLNAGYWGHLRAHHARSALNLFLRAFLPFLAMLLMAAAAAFNWRLRALDRDLDRTIGAFLELARERLENDLAMPVEDLQFLANESGRTNTSTLVSAEGLRSFVAARKRYVSIGFLDHAGREVARVDGKPSPDPRGPSDWSHSDTFNGLASLGHGELYVSSFELRTQRGRLVEPFEPIVRFGTPLADASGRRTGYLLIEFDAQPTLDALRIANPNGFVELLSADGYWIKARDPGLEWGAVLREREHALFSTRNAREWGAMTAAPDGKIRTENGGFWYRTVQAPTTARVTPRWVLVLHVPRDRIRAWSIGTAAGFVLVALVAALMAAPFYWWLARRVHRAPQG